VVHVDDDIVAEAKTEAREKREAHTAGRDRGISLYLDRASGIIFRWKVYAFYKPEGNPYGSSSRYFVHRASADAYFNDVKRQYKLTEVDD
jgi:hypothetical protein